MTANTLTWFTVIGHWRDIQAADPSSTANTPQTQIVSATVTFTARLAPGTQIYVPNLDLGDGTSANTSIELPPVTARIFNGELETINIADSTGVQLVANTPLLGLTQPLIYDVAYTNVTYASATRTLQNTAFTAPTTATTIDLTDPTLTRLIYNPTNYT